MSKVQLVILLLATTVLPSIVFGQEPTCKPFDFRLASAFDIGANSLSYTTADFNGDAVLDVAVPNYDRNTASIAYGDGTSGFAPPVSFPAGLNPRIITSGDMNNDGRPDIVVAGTADLISVLLANSQGNGFLAPILYDPPPTSFGQFEELMTGDFNGDSKLDVASVQNQSDRVLKIFLGDGNGNISFSNSFTIGGFASKLVVGRLNADSIDDIVASSGGAFTSPAVRFVYGNAGGNFALTHGFSFNEHAIGISIADLNEDGLQDLAIAFHDSTTPTNHFLQPWLQSAGGTFTGGSVFDLSYPFIPSDLTTGDYDNDGNIDMAVMLESMVMVAYGTGTGAFERHTTWATSSSRLIFTSDVDSDGHLDLVTVSTTGATNNVMSVLFNEAGGGFIAPKVSLWGPNFMAAADFNNDQLQDYGSAWETSSGTPSGADISLNDGAFGFLPEVHHPSPIALDGLGVGDFNNDGKADAVTVHSNNGRQVAVYLGKGDGTLETAISTTLNVAFEDLIVGDFNGDGKDDVFLLDTSARGHSWLSNGNGTFSPAPGFSPIQFQNIQVKFEKALYNNDQFLDFVIGTGPNVAIWLGDGAGGFTQSSVTVPQMADVTVGDYNNDGELDLAGFWTPGVVVALGDGSGGFLPGISTPFTDTGSSLISGDLNGDGFDDLAFTRNNLMLQNLVIIPGSTVGLSAPIYYSVGAVGRDLLAADYNNDGLIDLGFLGGKSRGVIYGRASSAPCITVTDKQIVEGDNGEVVAQVVVSLSASTDKDVHVNYVVTQGTATAGTDFVASSGRLVIPAGQTSATVAVPILPDVLDEFDETFTVSLSSASNAWIARAAAVGTILDDDAEPSLTISDVSRAEGSSPAILTVSLSAPSGRNISFRYTSRNGSAIVEEDYFLASGTWTIPAGSTSMTIGVPISSDSKFEPDEQFFVDLSEPVNASIADGTGTATLLNDDQVPTLSIFGSSVREGDVGTTPVNLTMQLSNPTYLPVNLTLFTSNGTAIGGLDYVHVDGPAVVPAGQQQAVVQLQIIGDTMDERTENFFVNVHQVQNANVGNVQTQLSIQDDEATKFDFDGDGRSDVSVYREADTTWHIYRSQGTYLGIVWGAQNDKLVPEDYDGDGRTNAAMFRNGQWLIRNNTGNGHTSFQWGAAGDTPVPADYDGDGKADPAVFRDGVWWIYQSTAGPIGVAWGSAGDLPVPGDYDGDGRADMAVVRDGTWWIYQSTAGPSGIAWGQAGDKPVPADYDGDGKTDVAIVRDGTWWIYQSTAGPTGVAWGSATDIPAPADYDGDGRADIAIFREGTWWIYQSTAGPTGIPWGSATDIPIPRR
ncbi:MAG: FG-GAP-like repeat-containing protein [Pyrinomonadaceae bacterium]